MNTKLFVKWLTEVRGLQESVAKNRASNCNTIEKIYGDLEIHYYTDGCSSLMGIFKYSQKSHKANLPPKHLIDMKGNVYTGTSTYRQALKKFIEFMNDRTN